MVSGVCFVRRKLKTLRQLALTGDPGSGKSAVGKALSKALGIPYYSVGAIQREMAAARGMNTLEFNRFAEGDFNIDQQVDSFSRELMRKSTDFVLDARMGWFFIPSAYKVYLSVQNNIAGKRTYADRKRNNELYASIEEAAKALKLRQQSEQARFHNIYDVELTALAQYDLWIDTSYVSPMEVLRVIKQEQFKRSVSSARTLTLAVPLFLQASLADHHVLKRIRKVNHVHALYKQFSGLYAAHAVAAADVPVKLSTVEVPLTADE